MSFRAFIWEDKKNRTFLLLAVLLTITLVAIFKHLYPFMDYIPDSENYIEAASQNDNINLWPIGYSKIIRLYGTFDQSDLGLAIFQYLAIEISILFFFYTILYFFKPGVRLKWAFFLFCCTNPLFLYLANFVTSDALFLSGSLLWFTLMIWILFQPFKGVISLQALVLAIIFTIRYNALFYPILIGIALVLAPILPWRKAAGFALTCLLIGLFIIYTKHEFKRTTGTDVFSPFSGWQLSNNALYAYRAVYRHQPLDVSPRYALLDTMVRQYYDTAGHRPQHPDGSFYLWSSQSPLKQYILRTTKPDTETYLQAWSRVSVLYSGYGKMIILHYPVTFFKFFIWPNIIRYVNPSREFLNVYNMGHDSVTKTEADWFHYPSRKVRVISKTLQGTILYYASGFNLACNLLFVLFLICYLAARRYRLMSRELNKFVGLVTILFIVNLVFSIFASPIVLRYQVFPMTIYFFAALFLAEVLIRTDEPAPLNATGQARETELSGMEKMQ